MNETKNLKQGAKKKRSGVPVKPFSNAVDEFLILKFVWCGHA
jgi:hypothetical protein